MENIVTLAIVGTQQAGDKSMATGTLVDTLIDQLAGDKERTLLLAAGALSVYRRAGQIAVSGSEAPELPEPAMAETLRPCSVKLAEVLETQLAHAGDQELIGEAVGYMKQAGLCLRPEILHIALDAGKRSKELRAVLLPVLGERGRWLSQFNPNWAWVNTYREAGALSEKAETIWQEGSRKERRELLQELRAVDAAKAREWLLDVWKQERADARADFLATLKTGLSVEDIQLLELAYKDRNDAVHAAAVLLLALLPDSELSLRHQVRADALLQYRKGQLVIVSPAVLDEQWRRDGIFTTRDDDEDIDTQILAQLLAHVPPKHWEERFSASPEQLIQAAGKHERATHFLEAWSQAAVAYTATHWANPLLNWWYSSWKKDKTNYSNAELHRQLLDLLPQAEVEQWMLRAVAEESWWMILSSRLTLPQSREFSEALVQALRTLALTMKPTKNPYDLHLLRLVDIAHLIHPSSFELALRSWELPEENKKNSTTTQFWKYEIKRFTEVIKLRKRIIEEISK